MADREIDPFADNLDAQAMHELEIDNKELFTVAVDNSPWFKRYTELNDTYVADEIKRRHGQRLGYCKQLGWVYYDDKLWVPDAELEAERSAETTIREMLDEAKSPRNIKEAGKFIKEVSSFFNYNRLSQALKSTKRKVELPYELFDNRPYLLNLENGVFDLKHMEFGDHSQGFCLTKMTPIVYDEDAKCPKWEQFLCDVMAGNGDLIHFLQKAIGYCLTDNVSERVFFILYGSGYNGKSTFLETILALLGRGEYACTTPVETLMYNRSRGSNVANSDIAALRSMRFVYASEGELGHVLAESKIKRLTGNDTIKARFLFKEWFDFKPTFKIFLGTNHKPKIRGTDEAIWDRIRLIPFTQCFRDNPNRNLGFELKEELPGILNWAIEGCDLWMQDGLGYPEEVRHATGAYRVEMDILGGFIEECCVVGPSCKVRTSNLFVAYKAWCEDAGERPVKRNEFNLSLEERGYYKEVERDAAYWHKIGLKDIS